MPTFYLILKKYIYLVQIWTVTQNIHSPPVHNYPNQCSMYDRVISLLERVERVDCYDLIDLLEVIAQILTGVKAEIGRASCRERV